jgi:hypothetical protein
VLVIQVVVIYFEAKVGCEKKPIKMGGSKGDSAVIMLVMTKQMLLMLWVVITNDW